MNFDVSKTPLRDMGSHDSKSTFSGLSPLPNHKKALFLLKITKVWRVDLIYQKVKMTVLVMML